MEDILLQTYCSITVPKAYNTSAAASAALQYGSPQDYMNIAQKHFLWWHATMFYTNIKASNIFIAWRAVPFKARLRHAIL